MEKQQKPKGGCCLIILMTMLILTLILVFGVAYGYNTILAMIPRMEEEEPTLSQEELWALEYETEAVPEGAEILEDVTMPEEDAELLESDDDIINLLLIGQDRRPGQGRQRSDSMILCTINIQ